MFIISDEDITIDQFEEFMDSINSFLEISPEQIRKDISELVGDDISENKKEQAIKLILQFQEILAKEQAEIEKRNTKYLN